MGGTDCAGDSIAAAGAELGRRLISLRVDNKSPLCHTVTMDYAKGIKRARKKKGISQRALGKAIGMDPSYLCLLEAGTRKPSVGTIDKIARACGVMGLEIFEWSSPPKARR